MVEMPDGVVMMVPTRILPVALSPLLGWSTKLRMGLEFFRRPGPRQPDRSIAEFIRDHYGQETVDYLAEPMLSGVYGGDPRRLSVQSVLPRFADLADRYGSLTRGVIATLPKKKTRHCSFEPSRAGSAAWWTQSSHRFRGWRNSAPSQPKKLNLAPMASASAPAENGWKPPT